MRAPMQREGVLARTPAIRFGRRHGRVLASVAVAGIAGATSLAGQSSGSARKDNAAIGSIRARPASASLPTLSGPFFRVYGSTRLAPAREGARYRVVILQRDDARLIPRLKAGNHKLKFLMYVDMMSSDPRDPTGASDFA